MPHPIKRQSSLPPTTTKSPSSSSSPSPTTTRSLLLEEAHSHATSSFQTTVLSVLHTAAVTCLRRILTKRLHEHFRSLPPDIVGNTSISIVDIIKSSNDDTTTTTTNNDLLVVTLENVETCQRLAIKVGTKWSEILQKQGYAELSNIALNVTRKEGYFLEQIEQQQQQQQPRGMEQQYYNLDKQRNRNGNEQQRNEGIATKYTTPHATLRALRRYPLDCDGYTGLPYTLLVDYDDAANNKNEISSSSLSSSYADLAVREAIRKIDAFASSNLSYWDYGYDGIIEAVRRNRDRIDYSRVLHANNNTLSSSATAFDDDDEKGTMKGNKKRKRGRRSTVVRFQDDDDDSNEDVVARQGVKTNSGPILKSRRKMMMQQQTEDFPPEKYDEVQRCNGLLQPVMGRPPSSIGDETYKWEDILNEMSLEERQQLIISSIHSPHPFESDMTKKGTGHNNDDDDDDGKEAHLDAIICGALKEVGKIHLWEQTRHYPPAYEGEDEEEGDNGDGDDEEPPAEEAEGRRKIVVAATMYGTSMTRASLKSQDRNRRQKRAMVRATKERLGRRIVSINEHKAAYAKAVSCSKVRWTEEEDDDTPFTSRQSTTGPQKWLEMDLGECTIELIDDKELIEPNNDARNSENDEKVKRLLSFRSLEVALMH